MTGFSHEHLCKYFSWQLSSCISLSGHVGFFFYTELETKAVVTLNTVSEFILTLIKIDMVLIEEEGEIKHMR